MEYAKDKVLTQDDGGMDVEWTQGGQLDMGWTWDGRKMEAVSRGEGGGPDGRRADGD